MTNRLEPSVGIYGGTFNPIHFGHLRAAEEVCDALGLARMIFIPSARPPHKRDQGDTIIAPATERFAWARLAVVDNPRFEVDPIEIERGGPSYLVETLAEIADRLAPARPVFTLGRDAFSEMGTWREPERLIELANFAVTTRPPLQDGHLADWLPACLKDLVDLAPDGSSGRHRTADTWLRLLEISALDISASGIRARIRSGQSIRYLVPDTVREAVAESRCYERRARPGSREDA